MISEYDQEIYCFKLKNIVIYHEATMGKSGVSIRCVRVNQPKPRIIPTNAPHSTCPHVWYNRYTLQNNKENQTIKN